MGNPQKPYHDLTIQGEGYPALWEISKRHRVERVVQNIEKKLVN